MTPPSSTQTYDLHVQENRHTLTLSQAIQLYREGYLELKDAIMLAQKYGVSQIRILDEFQKEHGPKILSGPPAWRLKHPCTGCEAGYGICVQGLMDGLQCCKVCDHPGRWGKNPYTKEDKAEMLLESARKGM